VAFALVLVSCVLDATRPRGGVPTLDDAGSDGFVAISVGREHSCGLRTDGSAWCWGSNEFSQLGVDDDGTTCARDGRGVPCQVRPVPVTGGLQFRAISAGAVHTCAVGVDDRVYCWGDNLRGAIGDPAIRRTHVPSPIVSTASFFDVAAGAQHSCALRGDGVAVCWGANDLGQVGVNSASAAFAAPATLTAQLRFASISARGERTCARTSAGVAWCWGSTWVNRVGGVDIFRPQASPQRVESAEAFERISAGASTNCAIASDNRAWCWSANATGAIGDGSLAGSLEPRLVGTTLRFVSIATGAQQSCGIADTGLAWCWGGGEYGQLGVSAGFLRSHCGVDLVPCALSPVRVSGWREYSNIAAGDGNHVCALTLGGNVYCWGAGDMGQRGDGRTSSGEWSPVKTRSPQDVPAIVTADTATAS
jgi:alpha-tubulin suppressor-like RCC1 family protein